ncbi:hypothetical protein ACWJJH_08045 [Endozoicomonadaceae bacterium StTr2]
MPINCDIVKEEDLPANKQLRESKSLIQKTMQLLQKSTSAISRYGINPEQADRILAESEWPDESQQVIKEEYAKLKADLKGPEAKKKPRRKPRSGMLGKRMI